MIPKRSEFIARIAARTGQYRFLRLMLTPFYDIYKKVFNAPLTKRRNQLFKENALEVLSTFDKCLTSNGYPYTLAFGTMLGAIRERGFIKHDLDLDVAMWIEDYSPQLRVCLEQYGFILVHELFADNGKRGLEQTYCYKDVTIDIFYIYPAIDEYPYCCDFLSLPGSASFAHSMKLYGKIKVRRLQLPWKKDIIRVPFMNIELPVPVNANEILSFRYGEDYMIPNPRWNYTDANKYITEWSEVEGIAKVYH